ncbi:MAG: hypothetical protein ACK5NN_02195 [Sphingomonadaceae bacterium]
MHIESMQSISGGTGKTTLVMERAIQDCLDGLKVLVIDTCRSPSLTGRLQKLGFEGVWDLRSLFQSHAEGNPQVSQLPRLGLICLPPDVKSSSWAVKHFADRETAYYFGRTNMAWFANHYDTCYIDCARAEPDMAQFATCVSDVVNYFPRMIPASPVEDWKAMYWDCLHPEERPRIFIESDRNAWHEPWVEKMLEEA